MPKYLRSVPHHHLYVGNAKTFSKRGSEHACIEDEEPHDGNCQSTAKSKRIVEGIFFLIFKYV